MRDTNIPLQGDVNTTRTAHRHNACSPHSIHNITDPKTTTPKAGADTDPAAPFVDPSPTPVPVPVVPASPPVPLEGTLPSVLVLVTVVTGGLVVLSGGISTVLLVVSIVVVVTTGTDPEVVSDGLWEDAGGVLVGEPESELAEPEPDAEEVMVTATETVVVADVRGQIATAQHPWYVPEEIDVLLALALVVDAEDVAVPAAYISLVNSIQLSRRYENRDTRQRGAVWQANLSLPYTSRRVLFLLIANDEIIRDRQMRARIDTQAKRSTRPVAT
ncbi:hypothetical protein ACG7TL_008412 [Trametes sanguinea]